MIREHHTILIVGFLLGDEEGEILQEMLIRNGLGVEIQFEPKKPSGSRSVVIVGGECAGDTALEVREWCDAPTVFVGGRTNGQLRSRDRVVVGFNPQLIINLTLEMLERGEGK